MTVTTSTTPWETAGQIARQGDSRVDLADPAAGLVRSGGDHLLGVDLRGPPAAGRLVDHWIRGSDLVAIYEPADPRRLRVTAMWRSLEPLGTAWELVVSSQTGLVESDSAIAVRCDVAAGDPLIGRIDHGRLAWAPLPQASLPSDAACLLLRRGAETIFVAVHPAEPHRLVLHRDGDRVRLDCWLFSTTIEKGVLLRSRVLAAVGGAGETAWAESLFAAFAASPPPLTT